jgi:hypothetical protein
MESSCIHLPSLGNPEWGIPFCELSITVYKLHKLKVKKNDLDVDFCQIQLLSGNHGVTPAKFGKHRAIDLGGVREQTNFAQILV